MLRTNHKNVKETSTMAVKRAYDYIRERTVDFLIRPGEQISEIEVAERLSMSRVPVREALNRLAVGGFVSFDPGKGFHCRKFSESEMKDLYSVRFDLEMGAVRQACEAGSDADISAIISYWKTVEEKASGISKEELISYDESFHLKIAMLCGNAERIVFLQNIYDRIRFVRKINIENDVRRDALIEEHIKLIYAILQRDVVQAAAQLDSHLGINSQELKQNIHTGMLRIYESDMT